ncbi:hypothetical protein [Saccharopolyspora sp. NPDC049426]|uniref:hypothetical protein n=1 Tax=Saccharopolyspora sp. NPDC049426 TaxID=3155652 RepID=UPI0034261AAC
MPEQPSVSELAEKVLAHPSVARLAGGAFGEITSYFPGHRITGVRMPEDGSVEIGVVVRLDQPVDKTVAELRESLTGLLGETRVDVYVSDVETAEDTPESA